MGLAFASFYIQNNEVSGVAVPCRICDVQNNLRAL